MGKHFGEETFSSLDLNNLATTTGTVDITYWRTICFDFRVNTGLIGSTRLDIECSVNGTDWSAFNDTAGAAIQITAVGSFVDTAELKFKFIRGEINVASGSAATGTLIMQMKV